MATASPPIRSTPPTASRSERGCRRSLLARCSKCRRGRRARDNRATTRAGAGARRLRRAKHVRLDVHQARVETMRGDLDGHCRDHRAIGDATIPRRDQRHVMTQASESLWQCRSHIGKAPRLRERLGFGCNHENSQAARCLFLSGGRLRCFPDAAWHAPLAYDGEVSGQPSSSSRAFPRDVLELRALVERQPELAAAASLQLDLIESVRRVQSRLTTPWIETPRGDAGGAAGVGTAAARVRAGARLTGTTCGC